MRIRKGTIPHGRNHVIAAGSTSANRGAFRQPGIDEPALLQAIQRGIDGPRGNGSRKRLLNLVQNRPAIGAVAQVKDRQQYRLLECS